MSTNKIDAEMILNVLDSCRTCGMVATEFCLNECGNSRLHQHLFDAECGDITITDMAFFEDPEPREAS